MVQPTEIQNRLAAIASSEKRANLMRFFKVAPGEYGEGDEFRGVTVPEQRAIAADVWRDTPLETCAALLQSRYHEDRLIALHILIRIFASRRLRGADREAMRRGVFDCAVSHLAYINNWDLVDTAAPKITGPWFVEHGNDLLFAWAASNRLWTQRMAIMSTLAHIRAGIFQPTLDLAQGFLEHPHDLMHKAVGWMLREVGKRDQTSELAFLDLHAGAMPRTMLRYAIEKFPEPLRKEYLAQRSS